MKYGDPDAGVWGCFWIMAVVGIISVVAWFTHIFECLQEEAWGFLIGGAIFFPIAIVHGVGLWFGYFQG